MNVKLMNFGMGSESFEILKKSLKRFLELRGSALCQAENSYCIEVKTDNSRADGSYIIISDERGAKITAFSDCDVHAAVGHLLYELDIRENRDFVPPARTIEHIPKKKIRGMYFATHFYNFYHNAPIEEVYKVIEDLAMQGCNNLLVWFDMHHFSSTKDREAVELIDRLKKLLHYANKIGIYGSMLMLSNEGFSSTPEELKAQWHIRGNYIYKLCGHYHTEICPSVEGGIQEILRQRREVMECFKSIKMKYIVFWPYDQGGCSCEECEPWGANGILKIWPHFISLAHEYFPESEVIFSAWDFDLFISGEWEAFYNKLLNGEISDMKYIMSFFSEGNLPECIKNHGVPKGIKFVDFPEISMRSTQPWGGFGGTVDGAYLEKSNDVLDDQYAGGFPYSEGIYESVNKFVELCCFYSGRYKNAEEAIKAFVRLNYCCDEDELAEALIRMEKHYTSLADENGKKETVGNERRLYLNHDISDIEFIYETFEKYNKLLPEKITSSRDFRLYYLRSIIDYELLKTDGIASKSPRCKECFEELKKLYHVCDETLECVRPPMKNYTYIFF